MSSEAPTPDRLLVILDREFGERLRNVSPDQPVWIVESTANTAAVKALWAMAREDHYLTNVTSFTPSHADPERAFLNVFDMIDLHQGPYSSETSYKRLEVIGVMLDKPIEAALAPYGFDTFHRSPEGFIGTRETGDALRRARQ